MQNVRAHIFVSGRVQGVFFRSWIRDNVQKSFDPELRTEGLDLTGWVQNLPAGRHGLADGRVEVVVEGEREQVNRLIKLIRKGPRLAKVEHIDVSWEEATGEFGDFKIVK